jgi:3-oxoacyl-ACP reductase-like protein
VVSAGSTKLPQELNIAFYNFTYTCRIHLGINFLHHLAVMTTTAEAKLPLKDKTALVTGSARGIGAAIALKLATEGADVRLPTNGRKLDRILTEHLFRL